MNTTKKQTHRYRKQSSGYQWGEEGGALLGEQELQAILYKVGYKDALNNMGNIANIL